MTDEELQQMRMLAAAATPGPWRWDGVDVQQLTDGGKGYPLDTYPDSSTVVIGQCDDCGNKRVAIMCSEDGAFIAASRTLVPNLLDEVGRLQKQLTPLDGSKCAVITGAQTFEKQIAERDRLRRVVEAAEALCDAASPPAPRDPVRYEEARRGLYAAVAEFREDRR